MHHCLNKRRAQIYGSLSQTDLPEKKSKTIQTERRITSGKLSYSPDERRWTALDHKKYGISDGFIAWLENIQGFKPIEAVNLTKIELDYLFQIYMDSK